MPGHIEDIVSYINKKPNPEIPARLICQLHAALWGDSRRHFAILTGLSGSGKTWVAQKYGLAIAPSHGKQHLLILPVQPGWYDPSALFGYVNPVRPGQYSRTNFLTFLLDASRNPGNPYTVVLDEFNLSRPEQFMAPLLSAMETGDDIRLHDDVELLDGVPSRIPYPNNLAIIGTVNMDETTHGLSDKVLDRAFVMEFWDVDLDRYDWKKHNLADEKRSRVESLLKSLNGALAPARMHFGWRVVDEFFNYLRQTEQMGAYVQFEEAR